MIIKEFFKSISKKEWYFLLIAILIILITTNIPYIYGYLTMPPGRVFLGIHSQTPADFPVYYSYINQVKEGKFLLKDVFTSEYQEFGVFNIVWLTAGLFAKFFYLSDRASYHLARVFLTPLLPLAIYLLFSIFFASYKKRMTAFFLSFGSGLGAWFALTVGGSSYASEGYGYHWPIDLWPIPHAYILNSIMQSPHLILSWVFIILILLFGYLAFIHNKLQYSVLAGLFSFILFNFHPYHIPAIFLTLGIFIFFSLLKNFKLFFPYLKHYIIIIALSSLSIFYNFWLIKNSEVFAIRAGQNIALLPPMRFVLMGFGLLAVFALLGILLIVYKRKFSSKNVFIISWFFSHVALIIFQTPLQSHFLQGLIIPTAILSTVFLFSVYDYFRKAQYRFFYKKSFIFFTLSFYILFIFFSNIVNMARDFLYYKSYPEFFSFSDDFMESIYWTKQNISSEDIILASMDGGMFVAGLSARRVYVGHGHETLYSWEKKELVDEFYNSNNEEKRKEFLKEKKIDYIFFSQFERAYQGSNFDDKDYAQSVYVNNDVTIYKVDL